MSVNRVPRRERERERHRREIVDAARAIIADRGLVGFTVDAIAKASEFAVGSIYRHFASKEELLEVVVLDLAAPLFEEAAEIAAGPGPFEARLDAFLERYVATFEQSLPVVQVLLGAPGIWPQATGAREARLNEAVARFLDVTTALVRTGVDDGTLEGDPAELGRALLGLVDTFGRAAVLDPGRDVRDGLRVARRLFLDGARRRSQLDG